MAKFVIANGTTQHYIVQTQLREKTPHAGGSVTIAPGGVETLDVEGDDAHIDAFVEHLKQYGMAEGDPGVVQAGKMSFHVDRAPAE